MRSLRLSFIFATLLLLVHAGFGAEVVGTVIALEGRAALESAAGVRRTIALKSQVSVGDVIVTGDAARLQILCKDQTVISLGENSRIVIDEYIYSETSEQDEVSSSLRVVRGAMRVITGRITALNPDRFRVRTRMATIGVRGCDVGFRLDNGTEHVYALHLPDGHSIWVEPFVKDGPLPYYEMFESGMMVLLQQDALPVQRMMTPEELQQFMDGLKPSTGDSETSDAHTTSTADQASTEQEEETLTITSSASQSEQSESLTENMQRIITEPEPRPPPPEPTPLPTEGPQDAPSAPPPPPPGQESPPALVGGHPELDDWEWGVWESGHVEYYPNRYLGAEFIEHGNFMALVSGSQVYDLAGFGSAGAVLQDENGFKRMIQGSCSINVRIGGSETPLWGGTFSLSNYSPDNPDYDSLNFSVDRSTGGGTFGNDGNMILNALQDYSLRVNGRIFDEETLITKQFEGRLVRPAGASTPTGATGSFNFQHGNGATAKGAFGATFSGF